MLEYNDYTLVCVTKLLEDKKFEQKMFSKQKNI